MKLNLQQITLFFLAAITLTFFLKENINSIAIIGFSIFAIIIIIKDKDYSELKKSIIIALPLMLYFSLALVGTLINKESNQNYLLRLTPFLVSPLFVYFFCKFRNSVKTVITYFIFANIIFLVFLDFMAIKEMLESKSLYVIVDGREYYRFLYKRLTGDYFNHIYLSTYSLLSMVLLLQFKPFKHKLPIVLSVLFIALNIVLLASRAVVISAILASIIYLIVLSIYNIKYLKYLLVLICLFLFSASIAYHYKDTLLLNRYSQAFEWYKKKDVILERNYSINNRVKLYIIGASMFNDYKRYAVNGTGLAPNEIERKYHSAFKDRFILNTITYNAHNQFINNFIDWGILGILLLCYLLFMVIKASLKNRLNWITFFWLSFCIILMMESMLIRHRGIVFFVFFFTLLSIPKNYKQE